MLHYALWNTANGQVKYNGPHNWQIKLLLKAVWRCNGPTSETTGSLQNTKFDFRIHESMQIVPVMKALVQF